ncbi:hypothetical protein P7H06_25155 [Paenibacillus larvae]|nr:hypothetical protein [Paenibacillus larvae]MDT2262115.1 hypothetical protein [Paenibacillus larvae]
MQDNGKDPGLSAVPDAKPVAFQIFVAEEHAYFHLIKPFRIVLDLVWYFIRIVPRRSLSSPTL